MKILIGGFLAESNAYVDKLTEIQDFMITTGEACADVLYIKDLAKELNVELVPSLVADGRGGGPVTKEAFDYILSQFKMYVKKYQHEVDGMFFFFHGASNVVDLEGGSGDHALVREIRKIVGRYMPIACVDDPHGNVSQELVDNLNILIISNSFFKTNDTLPNDKNKVYELTAQNYTSVLENVHLNIDTYVGQKIKFAGYIYRLYDFDENQFVLARDMIVTSDFQTVVVGFLCSSPDAKNFDDNTWVEITGTITKGDYYGDIPIIEVESINKVNKPNEECVYPPDSSFVVTSTVL